MSAFYGGKFSKSTPLNVAAIDSKKTFYQRVNTADYQGYGFDETYFWSNAFTTYGSGFSAWPDKSLSFWRWNPTSGQRLSIGGSETVWTIDNIDWYNNAATSIQLGNGAASLVAAAAAIAAASAASL